MIEYWQPASQFFTDIDSLFFLVILNTYYYTYIEYLDRNIYSSYTLQKSVGAYNLRTNRVGNILTVCLFNLQVHISSFMFF